MLLTVAGCGQRQSQSTDKTTTVKFAAVDTHAKTGKQASKDNSLGDTDTARVTKRLDVLARYAEDQIPGVKFPTFSPFSARAGINAVAQGDASDYTVYFSTSSQDVTPRAAPLTLHKQTPTSKAAADNSYAKLGYQALSGGQAGAKLTGGVTAVVKNDAKATAVIWHQGRYSITVQSFKHDAAAAKALAQKAEAIIAQNPLPKTETHGAIVLNVETKAGHANTVGWRETSGYYTISGHDAMAVLRLAIGVS
ncbi:hypothetical protein [Lacticaseibacillus camelliae]|uniref:hypothetical protein n=1 Tax=Lacticaseibacillus camelliae TaxID=381742 RepID=UPI0012E1F21D|nr:hypothetical protein [Lacticaseibacillus camelliae]